VVSRLRPGRPLLSLGLLVVAVVLVYLPSLSGDLVWDDVLLIRDNPALGSPATAWDAAWGDFYAQRPDLPRAGYLRPLPVLLNAATYQLWGAWALPYRVTNLLLHLGGALLLAWLLVRLGAPASSTEANPTLSTIWPPEGQGHPTSLPTSGQSVGDDPTSLARAPGSPPADGLVSGPLADGGPATWGLAAAAAALFALHPVQTEAVAFVSARTDLLAAVFALLTVHAVLDARAGRRRGFFLAPGFFVLSLLSKEAALLLPGALLALLGFPRRRSVRRLLVFLGVLAMLYVGLRLVAGSLPSPAEPVGPHRLASALNLAALYLRLLVWPTDLHLLYDDLPVDEVGWPAFVVLLLFFGWLASLRRPGLVRAAGTWLVCGLLPVLQLVPLATLASERYLYLPSLALALGAWPLLDRARRYWPRLFVPGLSAVLLLAGLGSATRALDWRDALQLWTAEASRPAASYKAFLNLGATLAERGRLPEARRSLLLAWERQPGDPTVWRNLVRVELGLVPTGPGMDPELRSRFLAEALSRSPDFVSLARYAVPLRQAGLELLAHLLEERAAAPARSSRRGGGVGCSAGRGCDRVPELVDP